LKTTIWFRKSTRIILEYARGNLSLSEYVVSLVSTYGPVDLGLTADKLALAVLARKLKEEGVDERLRAEIIGFASQILAFRSAVEKYLKFIKSIRRREKPTYAQASP